MKYLLNAIMGLGLVAAVPAFAQSQPSTAPNQGGSASGQNSASVSPTGSGGIAQKLQQDLQQSGFKNVRVMPESFLVRADDKDGHPVMMIVNPDSVTALTRISSYSGNGSSGSGAAKSGSSGSSSQAMGSTSSTPGTSGTNGSSTAPK